MDLLHFPSRQRTIHLIVASLLPLAVGAAVLPAAALAGQDLAGHNPYRGIDWEAVNHYKGAFHVHVRTDYHSVREVIERHEHEYGYDILARTSKNSWEPIVEDYADHMLIVPGIESTVGREHAIALFEPHGQQEHDYDAVERAGGIQWRAHPNDPGRAKYTLEEMAEQFQTYDSLIGMEIVSRGAMPQPGRGDERHDHRRGEGNYVRASEIWDTLLGEYGLLDVYGVGVTDGYNDMTTEHRPGAEFFADHIYNTGWTVVLSEVLTADAVKAAMKQGRMFWVSNHDEETEPMRVSDIRFDESGIELTVDGAYDTIRWIYAGQVIHVGDRFAFEGDYVQDDQNYVRFEIWSHPDDFYESDIVGSQAFGLPQ